MALFMAFVGVIVGVTGYISFQRVDTIRTEILENAEEAKKLVGEIERDYRVAKKKVTELTQLDLRDESSSPTTLPKGGPTTFGEWQTLEPNLVYKASSNGFIVAYTGGDRPAQGFMVFTGKGQDSLTLRTRGGRYDGTVCPVAKGSYWTVKPDGGGNVYVQWLPVVSASNSSP